jgi:BolA family transcriptional regulator, general stress-responsive regulator
VSVPAENPARLARMRELLTAAFAPRSLDVIDDSHKHIGHAGARGGQGHFTVDIVSDAFAGMGPVARHRAVYAALGAMLQTDIHALAIRARTPDEAG